MDDNLLLRLATEAGKIMIASGAETHRAEDTMARILSVGGYHMPEVFVVSGSIVAGIQNEAGDSLTRINRVSRRGLNLEKIMLVNAMSRKFVEEKIDINEAFAEVNRIKSLKSYPDRLTLPAYALASACFSILYSGGFKNFPAAFLIGFVSGFAIKTLGRNKVARFIISFVGAALLTALSIFFTSLNFGFNQDILITSSLMLFVPGVAVTNALRDIMSGDYLSGSSRFMEAGLTAIALAGGVGITLQLKTMLGGVL